MLLSPDYRKNWHSLHKYRAKGHYDNEGKVTEALTQKSAAKVCGLYHISPEACICFRFRAARDSIAPWGKPQLPPEG